ncbi:hypothetical protein [Mycoplasmoides pirum]|uniref:hypothetical protein n=1 Tax=Mycoplasmoides pirum TaxID=2122 RepID=UPI000485FAE4|nr:hypothetical protein [Mycoplasmoides pirum]
MAEIITQGFIINILDYQVFDQIVVVLLNNGQKHSLLSLGSRKINSKNARHLLVGNYNDIEFFGSRINDKMGRLKKTITIQAVPWEIYDYKSFWLLNEYINSIDKTNKNLFNFYKETIEIIKKNKYKDLAIVIYILVFIVKNNGLLMNLCKCAICESKNIYGIETINYSWICKKDYLLNNNNNNFVFTNKKIVGILIKLFSNQKIDSNLSKYDVLTTIKILVDAIYKIVGISFKTLSSIN